LTAFGWGTDGAIWTTAQNQSGQWTTNWTPLPGGAFTSRPAVALLDVGSGPFRDHFAIAAMRSDGHYYVRIQNQTGSDVIKDWTPVGFHDYWGQWHDLSWTTAPAIAFVPASSWTSGFARLVIAGATTQGQLDVRNDWFVNSNVDNGEYEELPWDQGPAPLTDSAPALTFVPPRGAGQPYLILGWGVEDSRGIWFKASWLNPASGGQWQATLNFTNGIFSSGPAFGQGWQANSGREVTLYGRGLDSRIWVTNQLANGGFSPIGTQTFGSNVSAVGIYPHTVYVSALINGVPFTSRAYSPY
jgi:hypothetical protein